MAITITGLRARPARSITRPRLRPAPYWLWSLGLSLLAAIVLLWPLPARLHTHALDLGDGLHLAWTLHYAQRAILSPGSGFGAPAAYPYPSTLLLNPPLYALAALSLPLAALGWSATAVYNTLTLLSFTLACWAAMLLGHRLTGKATAGAVAGLIYGFSDVRLAHIAHLNLLSGFWSALLLTVLISAWREPPRTRRGLVALAVGAGLLAAAQALSDSYNALYMVVAAGLLGACWVGQLLWQRRRGERNAVATGATALSALSAGALLAGALTAPILLPTLAAWRELSVARSWSDHEAFAAAPAHYTVAAHGRPLYDLSALRGRGLTADPVEQRLWPGAAALALAALGLLAPSRRRREQRYLAALAAIALTLSLGPRLALNGVVLELPWYRWLFDHVPLFASARVPARWAMLLQLAIAGLAALGAAQLLPDVRQARRAGLLLVHMSLLTVVLADVATPPQRLTDTVVGEPLPAVYQALARLPAGALLEWPLENSSPTLKHRQQYYTLAHGRP
ncbi:MAG: hypothetical protein HGA45_39840, partial [Chloroflexales bacterium]|nr:hypothetical protein [Chloroflexales bacterium]